MGDSENVAVQTSTFDDYPVVDYNSSSNNAPSDIGNSAIETTLGLGGPTTAFAMGDLVASGAIDAADSAAHDSSTDAGSGNATNVDSYQKENLAAMSYDEDLASLANASLDSSQGATYNSLLNGNAAGERRDDATGGITENGFKPADNIQSAALHQPVDGSALSAEEERLWSIVWANSLDFNAWTSLLEETEKMSEGNILKIRKVYDSFLAEFPLCYGYWKKYADHEARLSSIEKVAELYERAILGVTYSVDMWLHYCVFAINTYGDPDAIRSLQQQITDV